MRKVATIGLSAAISLALPRHGEVVISFDSDGTRHMVYRAGMFAGPAHTTDVIFCAPSIVADMLAIETRAVPTPHLIEQIMDDLQPLARNRKERRAQRSRR